MVTAIDSSSGPRRPPFVRERLRPALFVVAAWSAVGLLSASQYYIAARSLGQSGSLGLQILRELPPWEIWCLLTPLVFLLARRFPLVPGRLLRHLPLHAAAGLACAFVYLGVYAFWMPIALPFYEQSFQDLFLGVFRARMNVAFIMYWALIGVHHAIWRSRQLREHELESERVRADAADAFAGLARARLQALRSQLHPHFLFNTLHSIASLMDEDVPTARRLIARLSDLLRTTLEVGESAEVPLEDELGFLERYLDIERVRYGPRLAVTWDAAPDTRTALVPPLLLQPLVENAVRHGIGPLEEGGAIVVRARREDGRLHLQVDDDGRGLRPDPPQEGNGLRITRERLRHTYGDAHDLALVARPGGGVSVRIRLPFRVAADDPSDSNGGPS